MHFGNSTGTAKLDGLEARLIHQLDDRHHHPGAHVIGPQALLAVAQGRVDEKNFSHRLTYSVKRIVVKPIGVACRTPDQISDFRARYNSAGTEKTYNYPGPLCRLEV